MGSQRGKTASRWAKLAVSLIAAAALVATFSRGSVDAFDGSQRKRAVNHTAVVWAKALQSSNPRRACFQTHDRLSGRCDSIAVPQFACASNAPRIPARTAPEQIGAIRFVGQRAKVRLKPEARAESGRAWLILRHLEGGWLIELSRYHGHRNRHPYQGHLVSKFFIAPCDIAVYG
jgi:hypothetical protein